VLGGDRVLSARWKPRSQCAPAPAPTTSIGWSRSGALCRRTTPPSSRPSASGRRPHRVVLVLEVAVEGGRRHLAPAPPRRPPPRSPRMLQRDPRLRARHVHLDQPEPRRRRVARPPCGPMSRTRFAPSANPQRPVQRYVNASLLVTSIDNLRRRFRLCYATNWNVAHDRRNPSDQITLDSVGQPVQLSQRRWG
jgi:hypothetical protein